MKPLSMVSLILLLTISPTIFGAEEKYTMKGYLEATNELHELLRPPIIKSDIKPAKDLFGKIMRFKSYLEGLPNQTEDEKKVLETQRERIAKFEEIMKTIDESKERATSNATTNPGQSVGGTGGGSRTTRYDLDK